MTVKDKTIAMTGATGGIGAPLANLLIEQGATLVTIGRERPVDFVSTHITADLATQAGAIEAAQTIAGHRPDILINLAGIQYFGAFETQPTESISAMYQLNILTPALLSQAVIPGMKQRGSGHIVNVGSIFGSIAFAYYATYCSTKAALKHLSEGLRRELADSGISVSYVAPRAVKTALNTPIMREFGKRTGMTMDEPEQVAARILRAIMNKESYAYIGFPESFFVRLNALLPKAVDGALKKNNRIAADILSHQKNHLN